MTFKHKLSRRLALLKDRTVLFAAATLAAAVISCERPFATDQGADIASLVVWPKTVTLQQNQTTDFVAVGMTTAGDTVLVPVSWSVTGGSIVDSTTSRGQHYGHYKAGADPGNFKVVGKHLASGKSDTATAVVSPVVVPVAAVVVAPATANVMVDSAVQLVAIPVDSAGTALGGRAVTWTSGAAGVATVDGSGLVTGRAAGFAAITATCEGKSGSAAVTVAAPPPAAVASVSVSPASASVSVGQTVQLAATPKDANGNPLTGRTVTWSSGNTAVATVSASGLVTGVSAGAATITAASEGQSGSAAITVTSVPVASVAVSPASASVQTGQAVQLTATPKDANGNPLSGRTIVWMSSNTAAATVNTSGRVTGVAAGSATITATSEGKSGTAAITVTAPPPVTGSCLALPGPTITLSGLSTSPYQNTSLTSGTKIDATAAQWLLNTPDVWGYMGSSSNLCWHSGQILGTIPPSTPYEDNLNGYHLMYGVDVHGASPLVEGLTIFTGGDGITFDAAEDANWTVRDVHMTYIRDDCIENDFLNSGLVDRSFFDGCYDFMSARAYGGGAGDGSANTVTVEDSLIRGEGVDKLDPGLSAPG